MSRTLGGGDAGRRSVAAQQPSPARKAQSFRRAPEVGKTVEEVAVLRAAFPDEYPTYSEGDRTPPRERLRKAAERPAMQRDTRPGSPASQFRAPLEGDLEKKRSRGGGGGSRAERFDDDSGDGDGGDGGGGDFGGMSAREVLQNVSVAEVVKSNPVRAAYRELQGKYGQLLDRVAELEHLLQQQRQQLLALEREKQLAGDATAEPPAHIGFRFNLLENTVDRLGTVFMDREAVVKRQWGAATVINTACRGYDARRRWRLGRAALSRWWARAGAPLFVRLDAHAAYHGELMQREGQVLVNRSTRLLREIVKRWRRVAVHSRPQNAERLRAATSMMLMHTEQHLRICFVAWKRCAHGKGSRRNVVTNYRARLNDARARIRASAKVDGVIIKERLQNEMHMDATKRIQDRHLEYMVRYVFYCWRDVSVNANLHFVRRATRHYFKRAGRKAFDAWCQFVRMAVDQGAAWQAQRREDFRPAVNMRAVRQFRRRNLLKKALRALRQ